MKLINLTISDLNDIDSLPVLTNLTEKHLKQVIKDYIRYTRNTSSTEIMEYLIGEEHIHILDTMKTFWIDTDGIIQEIIRESD